MQVGNDKEQNKLDLVDPLISQEIIDLTKTKETEFSRDEAANRSEVV